MPKPPAVPFADRRRWTAADARAVLETLAESGLSLPAFARHEGLDPQRLRRWRQQLAGSPKSSCAAPPRFIELRPTAPERVEIVPRSGRVLRVPESIETGVLVRLVQALDGPASC
jgi:transposase-like protein